MNLNWGKIKRPATGACNHEGECNYKFDMCHHEFKAIRREVMRQIKEKEAKRKKRKARREGKEVKWDLRPAVHKDRA